MRAFIGAVVLGLAVSAAPSSALAQAQAPAPAPAAPATQAPPAAPAPVPVVAPFPVGTKYAFVNIQRIANESAEGRNATARVQALNQQKVNELNERNKQLLAAQQKLEAGANVLNVNAAAQLQKEIERLQIDIQRFTEDAQQEVTALQTELQEQFQIKLTPIIQAIAKERELHMLFSVADSGLVWGDPSLDLTTDIIARFDAANPAAAAPAAAPAARPAAPAPAQPRPAAPAAPAPTRP